MLDIAEVAEKTGLTASALRYYEDLGLIEAVGRRGLRRQYEPSVITLVGLISMGRAAGFSLTEIGQIFGKDGKPSIPREELHRRAEEIDRQIRDLKTLSALLRHVAECAAPSHLECPKFQKLMRVTFKQNAKR
ncbi:MAG: helix-turn-helix domain-containing protein [Pseudomonadota bacterium]